MVESWHYTQAAASIVSPAIANAPTERIGLMYSEFLRDEYWHGTWLINGLTAAGFTREDIANAEPLPATYAVIQHLRLLARTSPAAFASCEALGDQSGDAAVKALKVLHRAIIDKGLLPRGSRRPVRRARDSRCRGRPSRHLHRSLRGARAAPRSGPDANRT